MGTRTDCFIRKEAFTACLAKTRLGKVKLTCGLKIRHRLGKLWKGLRLTHREENFCLTPKYRCSAILSRRCKKPAIKRYFCSQSRHLLCRLWIIVVGASEASLTKLTHSQRLEHLSLNQACRPGMKGKCTRPSILQISLFLTPALLAQIWFIFRFKKRKKLLGEADGGDRQKDWISVCWAATSHQSCHRLFKL